MAQCSFEDCREAPWGTSEYCILHDPSPDKDADHFQAELQRRIEQQEADPSARAINLEGVVFPQPVDWRGRAFGKGVALPRARFLKGADFTGATFGAEAYFRGVTFSGRAYFRGVTFGAEASFFRATFGAEADFMEATFSGEARFVGATFSGEAFFTRATFSGGADFRWATFSGEARFFRATFGGEAYFGGATFSGEAFFTRATFGGEAYFGGATFGGGAYFDGATFSGRASFTEATFGAEADFRWATFSSQAGFSEARFAGRLRFTRTDFQGRPCSLAFGDVGLERPEEAAFEHVSLAAASLVGTDLSRVRLVGVAWREGGQAGGETTGWRRPWWWLVPRQRLLLYDHRQLLEKRSSPDEGQRPAREDYHRLELLYRQLRINLEASKQEVEAGQFYIGEMEMRRLVPGGSLWGPSALLEIYRWAGHYGESYLRPFVAYLALGLLFALGYLFLGVQALGQTIHYQAFVAGDVTPFVRDWLVVWWRGSLTTGLLLGQDFRPVGAASALLQLANLVANAVLIALTVIAVRRHFKR